MLHIKKILCPTDFSEPARIFLPHHRDVDTVQVALSTGAGGYILKQDAGHDLLLAIESVLRGEKFVSERLKG